MRIFQPPGLRPNTSSKMSKEKKREVIKRLAKLKLAKAQMSDIDKIR